MPLDMDHAKFIVQACRDWLDRKKAIENFKTTGRYKDDFGRLEAMQEEMAHIQGYLEEHRLMHGYKTVNDMFQAAKQYILAHRNQNEAAGVGLVVPGINTTADVGPNSLKKNAAKFGNKVTKNGVPPIVSKDSFKK